MNAKIRDKPPKARKKKSKNKVHGVTLIDDYAWLRDDNWQKVLKKPSELKPNIRKFLEEENRWTDSNLKHLKKSRNIIYNEILSKINENDRSLPIKDGKFLYLSETKKGFQYPILKRKFANKLGSRYRTIIDWNKIGKKFKYFKPGGISYANNHSLFNFSYDDKGSEYFSIKTLNLKNKKKKYHPIRNTSGQTIWANDSSGFYYIKMDENHRPSSLWFHTLNTRQSNDVLIYEETNSAFFVNISETLSKRYLILNIGDHESNEIYLLNKSNNEKKMFLFCKRKKGIEYSLEHDLEKSRFIVMSNANKALDFKISYINENKISKNVEKYPQKIWKDLIPHRKGILITDFAVLKDFLIIQELKESLPKIIFINKKTRKKHEIKFDEEAYQLSFSEGVNYNNHKIRVSYSALNVPSIIYEYNLRTKKRKILKKQIIPTGFNKNKYETKRIFAKGHDGEKIPLSILKLKNLKENAPTLLYGYGAYGMSMMPSFSVARLSMVDRGMVYAIAHIRGGMEKGRQWYLDGKLKKKKNTFRDFISCANYLKKTGISSDLTIHGGSAGGLLIGAALNMAPQLFKSAVADVPFVDTLNTILDASLPLTPPEWQEWGNPILNKKDFSNIRSYSPYDNIKKQNYPDLLVTAGLTDPRVTYWEAAKWVAKLREFKTDKNNLFLKTNMNAGHAGKAGRYHQIKETAFMYAFILETHNLL